MRKSVTPIIHQMKISPSVSLALFNSAWIYILNIVHKNSQGQVFASTVVICSIANMSLSYKINSFKNLSARVINKEDADISPLRSEKRWLANGLYLHCCESPEVSSDFSASCAGSVWTHWESEDYRVLYLQLSRGSIFSICMCVCINVCICLSLSNLSISLNTKHQSL